MANGRLDDYDTIRLLGVGATGSVYLGRHRPSGRLSALKYLRVGDGDIQAMGRFRREAAIMASLSHPGLVRIEELIDAEGQLVLVMSYVDGSALHRLANALSPSLGLAVITQLGAPLDVLHDAGVVHRDLKPANVLIDQAGRCHVTDFGVARFVGDSLQASDRNLVRTRTGQVVGTPAYLAPEVAAGHRTVDRRADVYALGVMAYQFLVGRLPFGGDAYQMLLAHIETPPPRPTECISGFPPAVEDVLVRALAKQPGARFARAGEFTAALVAAASSTWAPAPDSSLSALVRQVTAAAAAPPATGDAPTLGEPETISDVSVPKRPKLPGAAVPVFRPRAGRLRWIFPLMVVALTAAIMTFVVIRALR